MKGRDTMKIFINPGHGGNDPGAVNATTGYKEAVCVRAVGDRLSAKLESVGIETRVYQHGTLSTIGPAANAWGANYAISIHCNANAGNPGTGTETYHHPQSSQKSKEIAAAVQSELVKALGRANRGVKQANFQFLRDTQMPSVLVELLFINHPTDEAILRSTEGQEKAAEALAIGLCRSVGVAYPAPTKSVDANGCPYAEPTAIIGKNSTGDGVRWVQWYLNKQGVASLNTDGVFGPITEAAVMAFQRSTGLDPDGWVGPLTRAELKKEPVKEPEPEKPVIVPDPARLWYVQCGAFTDKTRAETLAQSLKEKGFEAIIKT